MRTLLLSIAVLSVAVAPVFGEDQNDQKQPKHRNRSEESAPPPPRQPQNNVQRTYTPRVQQPVAPKIQAPQNNPRVQQTYNPKTYTPRTYTPNVQPRTRTFTPPADQDAPRTTMNPNQKMTNNYWQNRDRNRTNTNVVTTNQNQTPSTTTTTTTTNTNSDGRNRNWSNNNNPNRNWSNTNRNWNNTNRNWNNNNRDWNNTNRDRGNNRNWSNSNRNRNWNNNSNGVFTYEQARRHHRRDHHHRDWWRSRYSRIALFAGGYYYWNSGYWYPAYGYDPYYTTYAYDEPIYGYNNLEPGQVIANVQAALQEQGYYNDEVDGLIGPNTRAALRNFQADNGLPVTAAIDGPTLEALGLN